MTIESECDALTIRCRLRRSKDGKLSSKKDEFADDNDEQEMICKMYQGSVATNWNLWDGMTGKKYYQQNTSDSYTGDTVTTVDKMEQNECEAKLSFCPLPAPPNNRTKSRSRTGCKTRRSSDLPNPNNIKTVQRRIPMNIRAESPGPRINPTYSAGIRRGGGGTPSRDCTNVAAACFDVKDKRIGKPEVQIEKFDVLNSDLISVQKDFMSNLNADIGVIHMQTRSNGLLEILPNTIHGRELLVAFLQSCLPKERVRDKLWQITRQMQCASSDDSSFDMQKFEASALKSRVANESIWDKLRGKSKLFSLHLQELCLCCEAPIVVDENGLAYKSNYTMLDTSMISDDDVNTVNSTVESVLSELELDRVTDENKVLSPDSIKIITCASAEETVAR